MSQIGSRENTTLCCLRYWVVVAMGESRVPQFSSHKSAICPFAMCPQNNFLLISRIPPTCFILMAFQQARGFAAFIISMNCVGRSYYNDTNSRCSRFMLIKKVLLLVSAKKYLQWKKYIYNRCPSLPQFSLKVKSKYMKEPHQIIVETPPANISMNEMNREVLCHSKLHGNIGSSTELFVGKEEIQHIWNTAMLFNVGSVGPPCPHCIWFWDWGGQFVLLCCSMGHLRSVSAK